MKNGWGLGVVLLACNGVVVGAEPPARPVMALPAPAAASTKPVTPSPAKESKPLDLRVGDVRKYMMPREFAAVLRAPDAESSMVIVEGRRESAFMKRVEEVPMGLPSLWYGIKDPKNAWRLFAPTMTFNDGPTVDKVPPPIFRWGP
jgi:hypothetical protein